MQRALISGDIFCRPQRLVLDLEAALMGVKAKPQTLSAAVLDFLAGSDGEFLGIEAQQVAQAVALAGARRDLAPCFNESEAAELFLVGLEPAQVNQRPASWLLLPYCAKPPDCEFRYIADCGRCGQCQYSPMYDLADKLGLEPVSIQSFEHLMETLYKIRGDQGYFVGSCCEAFYTKHQQEIEDSGAIGVLINLDSTTCYDLGKGMDAYAGHFDNQTEMNAALIEKVARVMGHA